MLYQHIHEEAEGVGIRDKAEGYFTPREHEKGMADLERQAMRDARDPITVYEEQFIMMDYNIQTALKDDYLEMAIQYGYITLFSVALLLPLCLGLSTTTSKLH